MDRTRSRLGQKGQVMVLFLIGIFAIISMVGLVLDGGSVFAQRRDQQTVADLAAMAGANAYLNATGTVDARKAYAESIAESVATANGYTDTGSNEIDMVVTGDATRRSTPTSRSTCRSRTGTTSRPWWASPSWDVSVTATARSSQVANGARGPMPLLFNAEAFPAAICNDAIQTCTPQVFQQPQPGNEDVPQDATSFNWTVFCTANGNPCNAQQRTCVGQLLNGLVKTRSSTSTTTSRR